MQLCAAIGVRSVVQFPHRYNGFFGRLRQEDDAMAIGFTMGSFGAYLPYPTILVGTDRLLIKGIKYMAGRMFKAMKAPHDLEKMPATSAGGESSGTFHFAVVEIVMQRHRHVELRSVNWPSVLDDLAKDLADHDLDEWLRPLTGPAIALKKRRVMHDLIFEEEDLFVTRPVPPVPAGAVPLLHSFRGFCFGSNRARHSWLQGSASGGGTNPCYFGIKPVWSVQVWDDLAL
ncbi:unnamed protein product [Symbiodinium microadriaticum]|nr:unnamed protein product [Symbiodinium microadriaticum]CAE7921059.1 unnamed protein product [Symbiodinium sp. KB8]